jgi:biopolymer transport protein TolQ
VPPSIDVYLAATAQSESGPSLADILFVADPIVQLDLLVLVGMSVVCWAIIAQKTLRLRKARDMSTAFLDAFWKSKRLDGVFETAGQYQGSPVSAVFQAGYKELARIRQGGAAQDPEANLVRALRRAQQVESMQMRRYVTFLATTGSTAPFIGLFGTVWGILRAFLALGKPGATATIAVVGPDIAHALVATAVGLVAAIPAVMAYNGFSSWIAILDAEVDAFSADFLNLVKRSRTPGAAAS